MDQIIYFILANQGFNFDKVNDYLNLNTPYDVESIMHYDSTAFAKEGTYTILSKTAPYIIPDNKLLSDIDAKEIQLLYKCTGPALQWTEELGNSWAYSCDFANFNLSSVSIRKELCSTKCRLTLGCTHYSWSNGVCYLKKNSFISKINAINNNNKNTLCGILTQGNFFFVDNLISLKDF